MNISIRNERFISFPYALKEEFREAFPKARWDPDNKEWSVNEGAKKRLAQWVQVVESSGVLQKMRDKETVDLSEEEVRTLTVQLSKLKQDLELENDAIDRAEAAKKQADTLLGQIQSMQAKLKTQKSLRENKVAEANAAREKILTVLRDVADVEEIEHLRSGMRSDWRVVKAINRGRFDEKQERLKCIRDDLARVEIESVALNKAIGANYNRRDRDLQDLDLELEFRMAG